MRRQRMSINEFRKLTKKINKVMSKAFEQECKYEHDPARFHDKQIIIPNDKQTTMRGW